MCSSIRVGGWDFKRLSRNHQSTANQTRINERGSGIVEKNPPRTDGSGYLCREPKGSCEKDSQQEEKNQEKIMKGRTRNPVEQSTERNQA
jgi:hypothetical protein